MVLLPVCALVLLWVLAWRRGELLGFPELTRRAAFVIAFGAHQVVVMGLTEAVNVSDHLTRAAIATAWMCVIVGLSLVLREELFAAGRGVPALPGRMRSALRDFRPDDAWWGGLALAGMLAVFVWMAWVYPPNNSDSLVYHLPRVEHWIQDQSVDHFATHYPAQLEYFPLNSYNFAHLHLLSGGDRFDGYLQLVATIVCVLGASELARRLGLGRRGQMLAAVLCATIPNVVLEATSTQNNTLAAAMGMCLVVVLTSSLREAWRRRAVAIGLAGALALMVKGTVVPLLGPIGAVLLVIGVRARWHPLRSRIAMTQLVVGAGLAVVAALLVGGPSVARNYDTFGGPTGPVSEGTISEDLTPRGALGNVIRSTASEFASGRGLFPREVTDVIQGGLEGTFDAVGPEPDDPRYLLGDNSNAFRWRYAGVGERIEEYGASPFHVVLVGVALIVLAARAVRRRPGAARMLTLGLALAAGYVAFTATARWSLFATRYYIPVLVLWCPLISVALRRLPVTLNRFVAALVMVACLPQLLENYARPVIEPRDTFQTYLSRYFTSKAVVPEDVVRTRLETKAYEDAASTIVNSDCDRVGLASWVLLEYPLWAGLKHADWPGEIQDVRVTTNGSRKHQVRRFNPCLLIRDTQLGPAGDEAGQAFYRFGVLSLGVDPDDLGTVAPPQGFPQDPAGLSVYPGRRWDLSAEGPRSLRNGAMLHLRSAVEGWCEVRIELTAPGDTVVSSPDAKVERDGRYLVLRVRVVAGLTPVLLKVGGGGSVVVGPVVEARLD